MKLPSWTQAGVALVLAVGTVPASAAPDKVKKRSTVALSFRQDQGTEVDIVGISPRSGRIGEADIKRAEGRTRIKLRIDKSLQHPQSLGSLYTTYVLWAVAPEGRAENLAEIPHSEHFDVEATTSFDTFGLIVTAEPYATVSRPGPSLIAESAPRSDTRARIETGTVEYAPIPERPASQSARADFKTPLLVLGARRAVEAAESAGASQHASRELEEAEARLAALEQLARGKEKLSKDAETTAREVMRLAENARTLSADRRDQAAQAAERREAQAAISRAQTDAERAADRAARERRNASEARQDAERAEREALKARTSMQDAQLEAERAKTNEQLAQTEAERAKTNEQIAQAEAARSRLDAQQAQQDKADAQAQLYESLSAILETRREARGLIVNLSDVLFDFDRASLKPGAREKLSRLAGILLAYPGRYDIEIEGHTDSVGTHEYNLGLSQDRAQSVSAYLREAGIPADRITEVTGFAETRPVASNDNAAGRQMNRRVELVIGDLES
jgi:outer membrane protein OmpA-like peptidoglycan-associated protein